MPAAESSRFTPEMIRADLGVRIKGQVAVNTNTTSSTAVGISAYLGSRSNKILLVIKLVN